MKTLGVIANCGKPRAAEALSRLERKAAAAGLALCAEGEAAARLASARPFAPGEMLGLIDALVVLGGDGTMLRAVRELNGRDMPVIGVNLGSLGFLTSVAEDDIDRAVECLAAGTFTTSVRTIADCMVRSGSRRECYPALNDVVITNVLPAKVVTLEVEIDGERVSPFTCDGLIVSTPTGSTGHGLSAGGPIVSPASRVFVLSMICAHTLTNRPLVVPDDSVIVIRPAAGASAARVTADGQVGKVLEPGEPVEVRRGERTARFIHLPGYSYFSLLRQKLHWRGSNV